MNEVYGNPSSLHKKGYLAQKEIEKTKISIAKLLNIEDENDIYFTSGGTEANNLAIFGACNALKKRGNKIVTTAIEHSSVYSVFKALENNGFNVIYLKPDIYGKIDENKIINAIDNNTILISIMMVNNEVGSILPVEKVRNILKIKNSSAIFHVDAVQSFGKIPVDVKKIKPDLLTISAHKVHGPDYTDHGCQRTQGGSGRTLRTRDRRRRLHHQAVQPRNACCKGKGSHKEEPRTLSSEHGQYHRSRSVHIQYVYTQVL